MIMVKHVNKYSPTVQSYPIDLPGPNTVIIPERTQVPYIYVSIM